jgi:hypothetical protein
MEDLYERTHETVHLGVLDEDSVVYVAKIGGHRQADVPSRVGGRMPLHCTAIGKALLAWSPPTLFTRVVAGGLPRRTPRTITAPGLLRRQLDRILEAGVGFEHEESAVGIACVAAPILDPFDQPVGAITITGPVPRFRPEAVTTAVRAAAAGVGSILARRSTEPNAALAAAILGEVVVGIPQLLDLVPAFVGRGAGGRLQQRRQCLLLVGAQRAQLEADARLTAAEERLGEVGPLFGVGQGVLLHQRGGLIAAQRRGKGLGRRGHAS